MRKHHISALFILTFLVIGSAFPRAGMADTSWRDIFQNGLDGQVRALVVDGDNVYVGGEFSTANGFAANRIAKWDGSTWSPLSTGMNGPVMALAMYEGALYAGGLFSTAGGTSVSNIAVWDGDSWEAVASGIGGPVHALTVWNGTMYAGGDFSEAGGSPANNVARWNGTVWSPVGDGVNCSVYALASDANAVYVGGAFTIAGVSPAARVAFWNGYGWYGLSSGMTGPVTSLAVRGNVSDGGYLFAGGTFTQAGGVAAKNLARWNGSYWWPLGAGTANPVRALAVADTVLYVGGWFTQAGGGSASYIARYSGTTWAEMDGGTNAPVTALAAKGQALYVGGEFDSAGGQATSRIALWNPDSSFVPDPPSSIRMVLTFSAGAASRDLWFGVRGGAARGIWGVDPLAGSVDSLEGEEELPPSVGGIFDARFIFPSGDYELFGGGSWTDIRNFLSTAQADTYRIQFQPGPAGYPVVFTWSSEFVQNGYVGDVSITPLGGASVDMKTADSLVIADDLIDQVVITASEPNLPILFTMGWNLVSVPVDVPDGNKSILFPGVSGSAYAYSAGVGYQAVSVLQPGLGYWLKFPGVMHSKTFDGEPVTTDTFFVQQGWNLIGSISVPLPVSSIASVPPGMITGNFFGYKGSFKAVEELEPMRGHWVKTTSTGLLILSSELMPGGAGAVRIVPDGEAPPGPPGDPATEASEIVTEYALSEVYPNPFNPVAHIEYALPEESRLTVVIFNVFGQEVARLADRVAPPGRGVLTWDASSLSSGVYFCRMEAAGIADPSRRYTDSRKLVLMK